jgi:uncharacterized protein
MSEERILRYLGCSENVIKHCIAVSKYALEIAEKVKIKVDKELIRKGALLHDMGRCKTHGIEHASIGGDIARELGLGEDIARIVERHVGAGIPAQDARKLGLPNKEYCPITPEEKIIAYADNMVKDFKIISFEESVKEFEKILGRNHPGIERMKKLRDEIGKWMNNP